MFFLKAAKVIAVLALLKGAVDVLMGIVIARELLLPYEQALARYAGSASSSGEVIDRGIKMIVIAIALGALAEIGRAVARRKQDVIK